MCQNELSTQVISITCQNSISVLPTFKQNMLQLSHQQQMEDNICTLCIWLCVCMCVCPVPVTYQRWTEYEKHLSVYHQKVKGVKATSLKQYQQQQNIVNFIVVVFIAGLQYWIT